MADRCEVCKRPIIAKEDATHYRNCNDAGCGRCWSVCLSSGSADCRRFAFAYERGALDMRERAVELSDEVHEKLAQRIRAIPPSPGKVRP